MDDDFLGCLKREVRIICLKVVVMFKSGGGVCINWLIVGCMSVSNWCRFLMFWVVFRYWCLMLKNFSIFVNCCWIMYLLDILRFMSNWWWKVRFLVISVVWSWLSRFFFGWKLLLNLCWILMIVVIMVIVVKEFVLLWSWRFCGNSCMNVLSWRIVLLKFCIMFIVRVV